MRSTQQLSISLTNELADAVKAKVASGEYANVNEVICEGLSILFAWDRAFEKWARTEVTSAYEKLKADPSRALTPKQVRASLATARATLNQLRFRLSEIPVIQSFDRSDDE